MVDTTNTAADPSLIIAPISTLNTTLGIASGNFNGKQIWISISYGITNPIGMGCNINPAKILPLAFTTQVNTATLYSLGLAAAVNAPDPLSTALDLSPFMNAYILNLDEFQKAIAKCPDGGGTTTSFSSLSVCGQRVYTRLMVDANNRFDDQIITKAGAWGVPPLFLKLLLMQESNLMSLFGPNGSGAVGIAQFTTNGASQMIQDGRANDVKISPSNYLDLQSQQTYLTYLNGINTACPSNKIPIPFGNMSSIETTCADFTKTFRAIDDSAFYLSSLHGLLLKYMNTPGYLVPQASLAWNNTPPATQQQLLWDLSAASYNAGFGGVTAALNAAGPSIPAGQPLTFQSLCTHFGDPHQVGTYVGSIRNGLPNSVNLCS